MAWFFKGSEFLRYNHVNGEGVVDIPPRPIADAWKNWPPDFPSVDCAISGVGAETELIGEVAGVGGGVDAGGARV
jgi:hypothetical protein